ncbi:MAG: Xaa-Pro peptidase family protein [Tannerellaceae bacterium]|jgi:Xaa-Pro aminopeptidase|nr:Xaa-Pro peptidase family protein [Tannerellaceae bacterium]
MIPNEIAGDCRIKWERIRRAMQREKADACLLATGVNLYYLTGRIFSGWLYLPVEADPICFVKRPAGMEGERVRYVRKPEQIADLLPDFGLRRPAKLLLEADEITHSDYERLRAALRPEATGNASAIVRASRMIKTPWEIGQFRISAERHAQTYAAVPQCFRQGMTDLEFQYEIERRMRLNGSLGIFRAFGDMDIFMGSILAGDNAQAPSPYDFALGGAGASPSIPIGASGLKLAEGMSVMVDMAGNYTAYMTDMSRTFAVGRLPQRACDMHRASIDIVQELEARLRPGAACSELYNAAAGMADKAGLSDYFMGVRQQAAFVGHGIGLHINELPVLSPRSKDELHPGCVIALEPKFVLPGVGALGIEDSYVITQAGAERLTTAERELKELA